MRLYNVFRDENISSSSVSREAALWSDNAGRQKSARFFYLLRHTNDVRGEQPHGAPAKALVRKGDRETV
jgi:hypothetical protein